MVSCSSARLYGKAAILGSPRPRRARGTVAPCTGDPRSRTSSRRAGKPRPSGAGRELPLSPERCVRITGEPKWQRPAAANLDAAGPCTLGGFHGLPTSANAFRLVCFRQCSARGIQRPRSTRGGHEDEPLHMQQAASTMSRYALVPTAAA